MYVTCTYSTEEKQNTITFLRTKRLSICCHLCRKAVLSINDRMKDGTPIYLVRNLYFKIVESFEESTRTIYRFGNLTQTDDKHDSIIAST